MALPRVFLEMKGLAQMLGQHTEGRFDIVGPWSDDWQDGTGAGIKVGISSGIDSWDKAVLDTLPDLKAIVVYGAGQAGIDLDEVKRRGISIHAGAAHAGDVAEQGLGMILAGWRRVAEGDRWVRKDWETKGRFPMGHRLFGRRVGIVGLGHIGVELANRLEGMGCEVHWWGPRDKPGVKWPRAASLMDLAESCDVLAVAAFAHDSTRGLITDAVIRAVGPNGLLLNLSRGFVVDEDALIAALRDGGLGYAALDVFETEPTPAARWADVPNCLLTPHSSGATVESGPALREAVLSAVLQAL